MTYIGTSIGLEDTNRGVTRRGVFVNSVDVDGIAVGVEEIAELDKLETWSVQNGSVLWATLGLSASWLVGGLASPTLYR